MEELAQDRVQCSESGKVTQFILKYLLIVEIQ
jgi:hypothetical protein